MDTSAYFWFVIGIIAIIVGLIMFTGHRTVLRKSVPPKSVPTNPDEGPEPPRQRAKVIIGSDPRTVDDHVLYDIGTSPDSRRESTQKKLDRVRPPRVHIRYDVDSGDVDHSLVEFGAFSPRFIAPKSKFILDIWTYTTKDYRAVCEMAKTLNRDLNVGRKIGVSVSLGTILTIQVDIPSLIVYEPIDTIEWKGEPANASFIVEIPPSACVGTHSGTAVIGVNGIRIAKLSFLIFVHSANEDEYLDRSIQKQVIKSAFASYANEDREEVLSRIQGMKKVAPALDIFLDVLSLRSGDDWEKKLEEYVPSRDSFFLFWSKYASQSVWVEREWRLALAKRGLDYIDPVPLADPQLVPPPLELNKRHFADAYVAYIQYEKTKREQLQRGTNLRGQV